jgi:hypothetical protein
LPLFYYKVNLRVEGKGKEKKLNADALGLGKDERNFAIKSKACIMIIRKSIAKSSDYDVKITLCL